jgi:dienelactone hydrolase
LVLVPDFFEGDPLPISRFPPDTEEKMKLVRTFITDRANPAVHVEHLLRTVAEAKTMFPSVTGWAVLGLCWGGKVCVCYFAFSVVEGLFYESANICV